VVIFFYHESVLLDLLDKPLIIQIEISKVWTNGRAFCFALDTLDQMELALFNHLISSFGVIIFKAFEFSNTLTLDIYTFII
jgi:hypothetical protein